jgi:Reverse transcriptase (RNA-dependent DNA polymerase)
MRDLVVTTSDDPSVKEATGASLEERELWIAAISNECDSKDAKGARMPADTAEAAPPPTHIILRVKRYPDGMAGRFKARIVAGGDHQVYGYDYTATHAPVVDFTLLRVVLYIALSLQTYMAQVDVKTAFLNRNLRESVFVMSPRGVANHPSRMYKLTKALYGLKQTQLARNTRLCADLVSMGFTELPSALCVYLRRTGSVVVVILVHVNDLGIFSSSRQVLEDIIYCLSNLCELHASHGMTPFLRVQFDWSTLGDARRMSMSQPGHVLSVLRRFQMHDSQPLGTPVIPGFFAALAKETCTYDQVVDLEQYQPMIRHLLNLGRRTRPDILAPICILARFCNSPSSYCHKAAKRILHTSVAFGTIRFSVPQVVSV